MLRGGQAILSMSLIIIIKLLVWFLRSAGNIYQRGAQTCTCHFCSILYSKLDAGVPGFVRSITCQAIHSEMPKSHPYVHCDAKRQGNSFGCVQRSCTTFWGLTQIVLCMYVSIMRFSFVYITLPRWTSKSLATNFRTGPQEAKGYYATKLIQQNFVVDFFLSINFYIWGDARVTAWSYWWLYAAQNTGAMLGRVTHNYSQPACLVSTKCWQD